MLTQPRDHLHEHTELPSQASSVYIERDMDDVIIGGQVITVEESKPDRAACSWGPTR